MADGYIPAQGKVVGKVSPQPRDYHGCIQMYLDVYPWMMDKNILIVDKSTDKSLFFIIWA
jgi:hypothetical protein